jgi:predicted Zn-dependent peptidase
LFVFAWQDSIQNELPRLRTQLSNRTTIHVERIPTAKFCIAQLWINCDSFPEDSTRHGYRHVLEHLQARGLDQTLDHRLETEGMFLTAETYRDAMSFTIRCRPDQVPSALNALSEVLLPVSITRDDLARESKIIREETMLRSGVSALYEAAWVKAFGDAGAHPAGNPDIVKAADPVFLTQLWQWMTSPENLAVIVAGSVQLDEATESAKQRFEPRRAGLPVPILRTSDVRRVAKPPVGHVVASKVGSFRDASTAAKLAVAFVLANELQDVQIQYQPSNRPGLVLIASEAPGTRIRTFLNDENPDDYFGTARRLVKNWITKQATDPLSVANLRGHLLVQSPSLRPETMIENLRTMTLDQFRQAWEAFDIEVRS